MIDEATITKAINLLQGAAPGAKIMLFGSYATGTANENSDLDLLVVGPELELRRSEVTPA
jgi:predicted nucleotidyltransferase